MKKKGLNARFENEAVPLHCVDAWDSVGHTTKQNNASLYFLLYIGMERVDTESAAVLLPLSLLDLPTDLVQHSMLTLLEVKTKCLYVNKSTRIGLETTKSLNFSTLARFIRSYSYCDAKLYLMSEFIIFTVFPVYARP
jgi:hypothetical protein